MPKGRLDRRGLCMTERLLLWMRKHDVAGVTRKDMERYVWRMQGGKDPRGKPRTFAYTQITWTLLGPIKRRRHRNTWGTNFSSLHRLDWIVRGPDKRWRVAPLAWQDIKVPIYSRNPGKAPIPPSKPYRDDDYDPSDHYVDRSTVWNEL